MLRPRAASLALKYSPVAWPAWCFRKDSWRARPCQEVWSTRQLPLCLPLPPIPSYWPCVPAHPVAEAYMGWGQQGIPVPKFSPAPCPVCQVGRRVHGTHAAAGPSGRTPGGEGSWLGALVPLGSPTPPATGHPALRPAPPASSSSLTSACAVTWSPGFSLHAGSPRGRRMPRGAGHEGGAAES